MFTTTFYILGGLFVAACAYFSYVSGRSEGLEQGMDHTVQLLADAGLIKLRMKPNGDMEILPIENETI